MPKKKQGRRTISQETKDQAVAALEAGENFHDVTKKFGISASSLSNWKRAKAIQTELQTTPEVVVDASPKTQASSNGTATKSRKPKNTRQSIQEHEGSKYIRRVKSCNSKESILVDVYNVLDAFGVTSHPIAHAIKKLLCSGKREKGNVRQDLVGVLAAVNRAIDELD